MPTQAFRMYDTPEETLAKLVRQLNYIFGHLDNDNISSYVTGSASVKEYMLDVGISSSDQISALSIPIVDAAGRISSTSIEGALNDLSKAAGIGVVDSGNYFTSTTIEGVLAEIGNRLSTGGL